MATLSGILVPYAGVGMGTLKGTEGVNGAAVSVHLLMVTWIDVCACSVSSVASSPMGHGQ